jgi:prepilin-type N-terminal cleavage/methylation domain-containing protein
MKLNLYKKITDDLQEAEKGFSLIETMIALTTLGVCLAYAMPVFLYAKINNSKSEIRTGALIVAQRVFDDIRARPISGLPTNPLTPEIKEKSSSLLTDRLIVTAMGRDKYRKFKVEIFFNYNGTPADEQKSKVYDLEGTFTDFE